MEFFLLIYIATIVTVILIGLAIMSSTLND